ncbi:hypothetical protein NITLEN_80037 [Nitrospira lenta]|uniref:Uncharacterized protein n=1 Tax=Nitrospira lenta TaxID=1436998 RepID=A0A330LCC4_9BACT|nr:hypothetical protein NITLEN_80037 [Nitrospira lenta]
MADSSSGQAEGGAVTRTGLFYRWVWERALDPDDFFCLSGVRREDGFGVPMREGVHIARTLIGSCGLFVPGPTPSARFFPCCNYAHSP